MMNAEQEQLRYTTVDQAGLIAVLGLADIFRTAGHAIAKTLVYVTYQGTRSSD